MGENQKGELEEEDRPGFGLKVLGGASPCLRRAFTYLEEGGLGGKEERRSCLLYTSPSPRDRTRSRMPSSA